MAGYSVGAAGVYNRLRTWEEDPTLAPDPERVVLVVTFGNPENKFGGDNRRVPGTGLPQTQPYDHLDVVAQYDSVADSPTRFGFYSAVNSLFSNRHFAYFEGLDVNDPDNLVYQEGNTTYMLIPAETLPMVSWLAPFVSDERLAELDARYRPLVERDYDRPAYIPQGEGADWGNGTPPPSLQDPGAEQAVADQPTTETVESESQPAGRVAGADDPEAEESAGAELVSMSESAEAASDGGDAQTSTADGQDSGLEETDLEAGVANDETEADQSDADGTSETRATEESADADESDSTEGSVDATGSDKADSNSGDSDKSSSEKSSSASGGSDKTGD